MAVFEEFLQPCQVAHGLAVDGYATGLKPHFERCSPGPGGKSQIVARRFAERFYLFQLDLLIHESALPDNALTFGREGELHEIVDVAGLSGVMLVSVQI